MQTSRDCSYLDQWATVILNNAEELPKQITLISSNSVYEVIMHEGMYCKNIKGV